MAVVTLNKKEIKKILGNLQDSELDEKLSLFGLGVERINQEEIDVEVTPNRPDLLSQQGILRALESYFKNKSRKYKIKNSSYKIIVDKEVESIRPYSMAAIVKNIKFTDERIKDIMQWQEKIHSSLGRNRKKVAIGYYVLNEVKFPVRYQAKKPEEIIFEPLEMPEKMNANQILSRHPCGRDYGKLLEGFDKFPVYYDSNNEVLSMPPIINSNKSGRITPGVSDILVECTGFNLDLLKKVITMAVADLIDQGGKAYSVQVIYGNKKEKIDFVPEKMNLKIENVNKLLGLDLKENEVKKLLEKMGYEYKNKKAEIPAYRVDIMHEVDLIEDIAIAYGYQHFVPEIPPISTIGEIDKTQVLSKKISEILTGLEFLELSTLHLLTKEDMKSEKVIEVEASKSDYKFLRPDLLTSVLKVLSENIDSEYPQKVFEIGTSFSKDESQETGIKEKDKLVIALTPSNFTELKQILEYLARMLNIEFKIQEFSDSRFIEGRTGKILLDNKEIGVIGEIHPSTLKTWHLKLPLACLELDLEEIFNKI